MRIGQASAAEGGVWHEGLYLGNIADLPPKAPKWNFGRRTAEVLDRCGVEIIAVDGVPFENTPVTD